MNWLMLVLRLIHVGGGALWVGMMFFITFYLTPAIAEAGPAEGGKLMAVDVSPGAASFERGAPRALFDSKYINYSHPPGGLFHAFAVSRDGQRFLIPRPLSAATYDGLSGVPVAVVINWSAALK